MQKKIIALAIAAAFSAPAFADSTNVTVYGDVKMSVDAVTVGDANTATGALGQSYTANKISSNVTKFGIKGAEDLGDGLAAIWQIEQQVDIDNAGGTNSGFNTLATRNSFLGLKDNAMGTVLVGRHDTPYKLATRGLDVFDSTIADSRSLTGGVPVKLTAATTGVSNTPTSAASFDGRQANVLAYVSPSFGGVAVAAAYVFGAEDVNAGTQNKGSATSVSATYTQGDLYAAAAYERHNFGDNGSGNMSLPSTAAGAVTLAGLSESAMKLGVGYKMSALTLNAAVERTSDNFNTGAGVSDQNLLGHTSVYVAAKYELSSANAVKVAYTRSGSTNNSGVSINNGASQATVGFDHSMSKRTSLFALYTVLSNDNDAAYGLTTAGSTGGTGALSTSYLGARVSALSLGMKHVF